MTDDLKALCDRVLELDAKRPFLLQKEANQIALAAPELAHALLNQGKLIDCGQEDDNMCGVRAIGSCFKHQRRALLRLAQENERLTALYDNALSMARCPVCHLDPDSNLDDLCDEHNTAIYRIMQKWPAARTEPA